MLRSTIQLLSTGLAGSQDQAETDRKVEALLDGPPTREQQLVDPQRRAADPAATRSVTCDPAEDPQGVERVDALDLQASAVSQHLQPLARVSAVVSEAAVQWA